MNLSSKWSLHSPHRWISVIKAYIKSPQYDSILELNLLHARGWDWEGASQFPLVSPTLPSLPLKASGSESVTGKCRRVLRESRRWTGTKSPSAHTSACCVGSAKPGARETVTSSSELHRHKPGKRGKGDVRKQRKKGGLWEETAVLTLAGQKAHRCQIVAFLPDTTQLSLFRASMLSLGPPFAPHLYSPHWGGKLAKKAEGHHLHFNVVTLGARKIFSRPKEINVRHCSSRVMEAHSAG